jgi:phosphatidate cytidylyltransferase
MAIANRLQDLKLIEKLAQNSHLARWATGLTAAPILIIAIVWGDGTLFSGLVTIAAVVALWEYMGLIHPLATHRTRILAGLPAYTVAPLTILATAGGHLTVLPALIMLYLLIFAAVAVRRFKNDSKAWHTVAFQLLAFCHVTIPLCAAVILRKNPMGMAWIFALLLIIFAGDIGAFYTGKAIGKHKLAPAVSPNKTVEGSVGGLFANLLMAGLFKFFFLPDVDFDVILLIAFCAGIAGQIGDLFISVLKRDGGIKDSSRILPGHGGVLDRIDALLLALPTAWILIELLVKRFAS